MHTIQRMRSPPQPAMASRCVGVVGTRVDHRDLVDADQVGVGARAGHHARVGRDDAAHQRAQGAGHARHQRRRAPAPRHRDRPAQALYAAARRAPPGCGGRVADRQLRCTDRTAPSRQARATDDQVVVAGVAGQHDAHAAAFVLDDAGQDRRAPRRWPPRAASRSSAVAKRSRAIEAAHGREDHLELAGPVGGQRVGRADPQVGDDLAVVVQRHLGVGGPGHEEAGVVAAGRALGGDPVAK